MNQTQMNNDLPNTSPYRQEYVQATPYNQDAQYGQATPYNNLQQLAYNSPHPGSQNQQYTDGQQNNYQAYNYQPNNYQNQDYNNGPPPNYGPPPNNGPPPNYGPPPNNGFVPGEFKAPPTRHANYEPAYEAPIECKDLSSTNRNGFIRKVYLILLSQIVITALFIYASQKNDEFAKFQTDKIIILIFVIIVYFVSFFTLLCVKKVQRKVPGNYL